MKESTKALKRIDASLPWRSSLEESANSLDELERDMNCALLVLTVKQRKFVILVISGEPRRKAYVDAGYKPNKNMNVVDVTCSQILAKTKVVEAVRLTQMWHSLKYGINAMWKRQQLISLYQLCTTPNSDTWNPNAANKSMQLLMQMDGDIVHDGGGHAGSNSTMNITINTGLPERIHKVNHVIDVDSQG